MQAIQKIRVCSNDRPISFSSYTQLGWLMSKSLNRDLVQSIYTFIRLSSSKADAKGG